EPVGGYDILLCDALWHQGGVISLVRPGTTEFLLPLELEEALEARRPVRMEYVDGLGARTERIVQPLHVRRRHGALILVAHCELPGSRRPFKLDRIVRLSRLKAPASANVSVAVPPAPATDLQPRAEMPGKNDSLLLFPELTL